MEASRDSNYVTTLLAVSSVDGVTPVTLYANPTTHRLLVDLAGGGSGTVQTVAVATANGFAGTSDGNAAAPTLTLTTSVTGVLYGNGTAMSALTIGSGLDLTGSTLSTTGGGSGTVTDVSVVTANGVSGSVATSTTTPAITLTLGAITPTSVSATSFLLATPSTDTIAGVFRRNNSGQAANIVEIQTEANAFLAGFDKVGKITVPSANVSGLTASEIVITDASKNLTSAAVATYPSLTELTYLKGVTSAIQTQLNAKGTGNVTKVGTPVNNQIGVWTGDGTIEGDANFTWDGSGNFAIESDSSGATGPNLDMYLNSASPAVNDNIATLTFSGKNSGASKINYAQIATYSDVVTSSSEEGRMVFSINEGGNQRERITISQSLNGIEIGEGYGDAVVQSLSSYNLILRTGNSTTGSITITEGSNGNIDLATDGTGRLRVNTVNVPTISSTDTLTNKRVTKRTGTTTSSATPTIATDSVDEYYITAQAADITSFTTNLSGTPTLGQGLFISIIGTAARAITWGASFANGPVALPTTTVTTTQLSVFFKWDGSVWRCYATGSTV